MTASELADREPVVSLRPTTGYDLRPYLDRISAALSVLWRVSRARTIP